MTGNVRLKPKQQLAIQELLTGKTIEQASAAVGVSDRTLRRWMENDDFRRFLNTAMSDLARMAARRLAGLLDKTVDELEKLLNSSGLKPLERLQVIKTVLTSYSRTSETVLLEDRIAEIERMLDDK